MKPLLLNLLHNDFSRLMNLALLARPRRAGTRAFCRFIRRQHSGGFFTQLDG